MLDPRIYRTGLVAVALAVLVLGFSLANQQGALGTTVPPAFNGASAYSRLLALAQRYPDRSPGSPGDEALAGAVAGSLRRYGFTVSTSSTRAPTAGGVRTLETVSGTRVGLSSGTIVIVAPRDARGRPAVAALSGTAVLLELARVLSGETQHRTLALVSTSGSAGNAGAAALAGKLPGPIDAVIALGDMAGNELREPVVVPWSDRNTMAPTALRNTLAAALGSQAGLRAGGTSLAGQFAHLAFPVSLTAQAPFGGQGDPAVLVSLAGEHPVSAGTPVTGAERITGMGQAVLESVNALDEGPSIQPPSTYMLLGGKVVPGWTIRLLVLALLLPVLFTLIDGLARARRRGHALAPRLIWVLAGAAPFLLAALLVRGAGLVGWVDAPPGPVAAGVVPVGVGGVLLMLLVALILAGGLIARRLWLSPAALRSPARSRDRDTPQAGAFVAMMLVLLVLALIIWSRNAFAAALLVPALHLWLWGLQPGSRLPRLARPALLLIGLAGPALILLYYSLSLGFGPGALVWNGLLMFAGGYIAPAAALGWSVALGCLVSAIAICVRLVRARLPQATEAPVVSVRGPMGYAGPGSLGGTQSALRR
jgi:hypothetical protein